MSLRDWEEVCRNNECAELCRNSACVLVCVLERIMRSCMDVLVMVDVVKPAPCFVVVGFFWVVDPVDTILGDI